MIAPRYSSVYENTIIRGAIYQVPPLNLAAIAGALTARGHQVKIVDMGRRKDHELIRSIKDFSPDFAGISFTTPLAEEAFRLAELVKKIKKDVLIISGGAHSTALPLSVLQESVIDVVFIGEGDYSVVELIGGKPATDIKGIGYKQNGEFIISPNDEFIYNLDDLAFPAWDLFDLSEYRANKVFARRNPAGSIETSRGCPYGCIYCNKKIFGKSFRPKSAGRVIDEMAYMLRFGFGEIHVADDCFSFDLERSKIICEEIIRKKLGLLWTLDNGIRVDKVDDELLNLMRRSGCYRLSFGIESGDENILKLIKKGQTIEEVRRAVKMAKRAGLEVAGFFMFALPGETSRTMQETIDLARNLDLDIAKVAIAIPFPGTEYSEDLLRQGRITRSRWADYNIHFSARNLYTPSVDWDTIEHYYKKFYREFYLRPSFIIKRAIKSILNGRIIEDIRAVIASFAGYLRSGNREGSQ